MFPSDGDQDQIKSFPGSILPVIDLMNGHVVHARAGERSQYQHLVSTWCEQAYDPLKLTESLRQQLGLNEYYLADLNALEGQEIQRKEIATLIDNGFHLWLDAGILSPHDVQQWLAQDLKRFIIASESITSLSLLQQLFDFIPTDRLVFSLDLVNGQLRAKPGVFSVPEPLTVVDRIVEMGCRQFIVLDTAAVGMSKGPTTLSQCRQIRERHPECAIISGGGIRNRTDIIEMEEAGAERVLVSTWLHQGCP